MPLFTSPDEIPRADLMELLLQGNGATCSIDPCDHDIENCPDAVPLELPATTDRKYVLKEDKT